MKAGSIYAILYVILMALSIVWIDQIHIYFTTAFMLALVSFSAVVIYSFGNVRQLSKAYQSIVLYPILWCVMSATFALTWWLMYYSTVMASPRAAIVIFYLVVGLIGCWVDRRYLGLVLCVIALVVSLCMLPELSYITIISSLLCGLFGYLYMHYSGVYAKQANLTASQVLSVRFLLLFVLSFLYLMFFSHIQQGHHGISVLKIVPILILLISLNLAPNYFAQKSVMLSGANRFSQVIAFTPAVTFCAQGIFNGVWDWGVLILCLLVSILLSVLIIYKKS